MFFINFVYYCGELTGAYWSWCAAIWLTVGITGSIVGLVLAGAIETIYPTERGWDSEHTPNFIVTLFAAGIVAWVWPIFPIILGWFFLVLSPVLLGIMVAKLIILYQRRKNFPLPQAKVMRK